MSVMRVYIGSVLFHVLYAFWTLCIGICGIPFLLLPRNYLRYLAVTWIQGIFIYQRYILGIHYEIENAPDIHSPDYQPAIYAARHESSWETFMLYLLLKDAAFVYKSELNHLPLLGWYFKKAQMIAIERGKKGQAIESLLKGASRIIDQKRDLIIFPEGTRIPHGEIRPYKYGITALYKAFPQVKIIPVALNSGLFWPRRKLLLYPGCVKVKFLPPLDHTFSAEVVAQEIQHIIHSAHV